MTAGTDVSQTQQPVIVKTYPGKSQAAAGVAFAADASALSAQGYQAGNQSWSPPSVGRLIITPIILIAVGYLIYGGIGALVGAGIGIVYLLSFRPKGALTVTYTRAASTP